MKQLLAFSLLALLSVGTPSLLSAEVQKVSSAEPARPVIMFGRSLDIMGTPLRPGPVRLARSFNPNARNSGLPGARPIGLPLRAMFVSSGFGMRWHPLGGGAKFHCGVDFPAPVGTPVNATASGVVVFSGWDGGYGLSVVIEHGSGTRTLFGHLSGVSVGSGDPVNAGQVIGQVGSTGRSTGPHLHYEIREGGRPVDPRAYF